MWAELAEATQQDREQQSVLRCMNEGGSCPKPYATFMDELSNIDGVIMKGQRVVVPEKMRPDSSSASTELLSLSSCISQFPCGLRGSG